jgi:hypothetical protein
VVVGDFIAEWVAFPTGVRVMALEVLIFDRSPQAFDENVVHESAAAVHADYHASVQQLNASNLMAMVRNSDGRSRS